MRDKSNLINADRRIKRRRRCTVLSVVDLEEEKKSQLRHRQQTLGLIFLVSNDLSSLLHGNVKVNTWLKHVNDVSLGNIRNNN